METRFTWNPAKAEQNERDHHISFETAGEVFEDPYHVVSENYFVEDEQRYQVIGMTRGLVLLIVVFVDRSNPETEIIHIISARKAVQYEKDTYTEQNR
jgi:uncharacterized protein